MQAMSKAQLAAALVATFGFSMHGPAFAGTSDASKMGVSEKQAPSVIAQAAQDEKGKEGSCKGKEGSCKGKEGSCKGKESSCKGKSHSCKGKSHSCKGKSHSCKGKESKESTESKEAK